LDLNYSAKMMKNATTEQTFNTPMLKQYAEIKKDYPDSILFFRLGDFYEMFMEDAIIASRELNLTLTGRGKDNSRVPMCGIPFHAVNNYLPKLVERDYKVAICEQVNEIDETSGITKREVVKVVTPGTLMMSSNHEDLDNTFLFALCKGTSSESIGVAFADISTGEFKLSIVNTDHISTILSAFSVKELLIDDQLNKEMFDLPNVLTTTQHMLDTRRAEDELTRHFQISNLSAFGIHTYENAFPAAWAIMSYLQKTQKNNIAQITKCAVFNWNSAMILDRVTIRNLELTRQLVDNKKKGSLFWVINHTKTPMGARRLLSLLTHPSTHLAEINQRLDAVEVFKENLLAREDTRAILNNISDIERLLSKIVSKTNNPRDLISLKNSMINVYKLAPILSDLPTVSKLESIHTFFKLMHTPDHPIRTSLKLISNAIQESPPTHLREGQVIKIGFNEELDLLISSFKEIRNWINRLEENEKETTGIKSLKVGYNKVFGYYFQISNAYNGDIPSHYIRKQTLTNAERYITPELKEKESILLKGEEKQIELETKLYDSIIDQLIPHVALFQELSMLVAELDCIQSLATHAQKYNYCRPIFEESTDKKYSLQQNRHPILEKTNPSTVVCNDFSVSPSDTFSLITGPNMAGKSTFMRQIALTQILAQMGAFVPASRAVLPIVDRIFTRIGAADNLNLGQSTFMVEMLETASILNNATKNSLILLDEIGRGTSTYDGLSIASAISEYIYTKIQAQTFFATHYHELSQLAEQFQGIQNYCMTINEISGKLLFTYKIQQGAADKSYGLHVASMAGIPKEVLTRASKFLSYFESQNHSEGMTQLKLF